MVEAHSGHGGPPTTLLHLALTLSARRPVTVAIPPGRIAEQILDLAPHIEVVLLPRWSAERRSSLRWKSLVKLRRSLAVNTIVHANGKSALNLVAPAMWARKNKPLVFVHFHDSTLPIRTAKVLRTWSRLGIRTNYAPVSDSAASLLQGAKIGPIVGTLPNPISKVDARAIFGASPCSVAFVGSRNQNKGLDRMIEVAHRLRDFPVTWSVYGINLTRPPEEFLRQCLHRIHALGLADRIKWMGRQEELPKLLTNHSALLVTSRRESFCRVALEGMAAGLPVVAGAIPGLVEAVGEGNCELFDSDDLDSAADTLRRVLTNSDLFERLQSAGIARADEYRPERVCDQLEELYEKL